MPDEDVPFRNAVDSGKAMSCLIETVELIRKLRKYGEGTEEQTLDEIVALIRETFPDLDER